jgi:uncharacterized protein (DUF1800 family)
MTGRRVRPGLHRRSLLRAGGAMVAAGLLPTIPVARAAATGFDGARHLLARTGFGAPTPAEVAALESLDHGQALERLLGQWRPRAATPPPEWIGETARELREQVEAFRRERDQAPAGNPPGADGATAPKPVKKGVDGRPLRAANPRQEQVRELRNWWLEEMIATDQPLVERMVLFWHNHFTSGFQKVRHVPALYHQNDLFRRHALGNFGALLRAVARDPAMLVWLDGVQNRVRAPNENFARELLELFTLGEGHYTEADIRAAARAFTGWSIDPDSGAFRVYPAQHDGGEKTFLGRTGRFGGDDIVGILLEHPRTAEWVTAKLWREFVSIDVDAAEVKRLAAVFRASRYELRPLLRAMLDAPAFRDPARRGTLIKSPVDLIVGTVRVLGLPVPEKTRLARGLQALGQVLFDPPNVKGWPGGQAWITTNTLMLRQQILRRIVEATTVAPMEGDGMRPATGRRAERMEQMADREQMMDPRPIEGRSLRNAGTAARLGPTLAAADPSTLVRTLLPIPPLSQVPQNAPGGVVVAELLLDPAYQLK